MREPGTNLERYGFLSKAEGRYLFARSIDSELKNEVDKEKALIGGSAHHLQVYQRVLSRLYGALPPAEVSRWEQMAEDINSGNGSDELKAQ